MFYELCRILWFVLGFYYPVLSLSKILILTTLVVTDPALTLSCINKTYLAFNVVCFSGRHASKVTEEEEDEEYLKGEEDGVSNTRLVTQPSCKCSFSLLMCLFAWFTPHYICLSNLFLFSFFTYVMHLALFFYVLVKIDIFFHNS